MEMKKLFVSVLLALCAVGAVADEGMWLLPYLQKMNIGDMKAKGFKLSAEDIYSVNNHSLKDAVVIFGGGCTGEVVSPEGLVFTNHHCGYGSIQALSSVEHDYLKNGFWAMTREQELPAEGLSVTFIRKIYDVTEELLGNVPDTAGEEERTRIIRENAKAVAERLKEETGGMRIVLNEFFGGNQYFAFATEVYRDIRLVGTPPTSIGKFGGDTDNWMWPRHTGDFSVFRIYADKDGKPAEYSKDNVPYRSPAHLKVSLKGVKPGDFTMIMGFPGSTDRFMTSWEIDQVLEHTNPNRIFIRGQRQEILMEDMLSSDKVRIQYASKYASSSNYWKNAIGMSRGLRKLDVKAKKEAQEAAFTRWVEQGGYQEYADALPAIREAVGKLTPVSHVNQYIAEALRTPLEMVAFSSRFKTGMEQGAESAKSAVEAFYKNYNEPTERKVAKRMLALVKENLPAADLPGFYAEVIDKDFGGDIDAYVDYLYDNSLFATEERAAAFADNFSQEAFDADPATVLAASIREKMLECSKAAVEWSSKLSEGQRKYIKGLMAMQPDKMWYPDANFTLRLTYGNVFPYNPADGVTYDYYTTLKGVMEKEDPSNPLEFTVSDKLKALYAAGDYGDYGEQGEMHTCFISNNDITGGNSGSPVLNDKGELIGLAFDGNWEAMSGDIAFEPDLQRCINVDVRYVLFVIDKFAGAGHLLEEMTLVK